MYIKLVENIGLFNFTGIIVKKLVRVVSYTGWARGCGRNNRIIHGLALGNYKFSNWSTLRLVLPFLISLRVLYLSLPCFTFSLWSRSILVSLVSSLDTASSDVKAYNKIVMNA